MSGKKKSDRKKQLPTERILLAIAILELIRVLMEIIKILLE